MACYYELKELLKQFYCSLRYTYSDQRHIIHTYFGINAEYAKAILRLITFCLRSCLLPHNLCVKLFSINLSRSVRKRDFCLGENKGADQLRGNREADQRLCFRYSDSTIPLLLKSEISSFYLFSELVQAGLCRTWLETPKTGFLASRLNL